MIGRGRAALEQAAPHRPFEARRFAPSASEAANLSISAIFDMSQIKDLAPPEFDKIEKIRSL